MLEESLIVQSAYDIRYPLINTIQATTVCRRKARNNLNVERNAFLK